jgi:hypothetical protein
VTKPLIVRSPVAWHYVVRLVVAIALSYPVFRISHLARTETVGWIVGTLLWGLIFETDNILARRLARRRPR